MSNLKTFFAPVTRGLGRAGLKLRKASPEICLALGMVGGVATVVTACRATLKADEVLDRFAETKEKIVEADKVATEQGVEYNKNSDMVIAYRDLAFDFIKLYGPSIALGVASCGLVLCSYGIMRKRNLTLVAAYKALDEGFKKYRERAVDKFGEEVDRELAGMTSKKKVLVKDVNRETGEEINEEREVEVKELDATDWAQYDRIFSRETSSREDCFIDPYLFEAFLKSRERYWTTILQTRGYVFLDEVYKDLGFEVTSNSRLVGWIIDKADKNACTKEVSFGNISPIFQESGEHVYPTGRIVKEFSGRSAYLTFNIDGLIWDLI